MNVNAQISDRNRTSNRSSFLYAYYNKNALCRLVFMNLYHKKTYAMTRDINYNIKLVIKDYIFIQDYRSLLNVDIKKYIYT